MVDKAVLTYAPRRLRLIAAFEALKGILALALGFGIMASLDESLSEAAQELVLGLHLNPSNRLPDMFLDAINGMHSGQVWIAIISAILYSIVRFLEAYGLWNKQRWAVWVSALGGSIYLPLEAYELWNKITWFRVVSTLINLAIIVYMTAVLWRSRRKNLPRIANAT